MRRTSLTSWWLWDVGSRPLFWRWPEAYQERARDGLHWWAAVPTELGEFRWRNPQPDEPNAFKKAKMLLKLAKVLPFTFIVDRKQVEGQGYMEEGLVQALMHFFSETHGHPDGV